MSGRNGRDPEYTRRRTPRWRLMPPAPGRYGPWTSGPIPESSCRDRLQRGQSREATRGLTREMNCSLIRSLVLNARLQFRRHIVNGAVGGALQDAQVSDDGPALFRMILVAVRRHRPAAIGDHVEDIAI